MPYMSPPLFHIVTITATSTAFSTCTAPISGDAIVLRNIGTGVLVFSPDNGTSTDTLAAGEQFYITTPAPNLPFSGVRGTRYSSGDLVCYIKPASGSTTIKFIFWV